LKDELNDKHQKWIASWLDAVQDGRATMSQRALSSVNSHGGLGEATKAARLRGIHLVELTDDNGRKLIAASRHPFKALC
jgi:hypothetical protein